MLFSYYEASVQAMVTDSAFCIAPSKTGRGSYILDVVCDYDNGENAETLYLKSENY